MDALRVQVLDKFILWKVGVSLDLVGSRFDAGGFNESLDRFNVEVADTNGADLEQGELSMEGKMDDTRRSTLDLGRAIMAFHVSTKDVSRSSSTQPSFFGSGGK